MISLLSGAPVQLNETLNTATSHLTGRQIASPRLTAELLLMFALNCERSHLYAHPERELTATETLRFENALRERMRGVPTQYITGHQEFWGLDFLVSPAVLIPRPETEHLIETVLELVRASETDGQDPSAQRLSIADVGTGSGCIAVVLAKEFPQAEVHAIDISAAAIGVARTNASRHHVDAQIHFHQSDMLSGFQPGFFDLVVSNPPYVGMSEQAQLQTEVRDFEPHRALFAGLDGMDVIRRLVPAAHNALKPGGFLVMEIGSSLAKPVAELLKAWDSAIVTRDLQSLPRVARARKPGSQ